MMEITLPMCEYYSQLLLPGFTPKLQLQLEYKANYLASELSEELQDTLAEKHSQINVDYDGWWDWAYEGFKEDMKKIGFNVDKIYFSGFWSQGDGACFEGSIDNIDTFFDKMVVPKLEDHHRVRLLYDPPFKEALLDNLSCRTSHSGHYYHSGCMDVSFDMDTIIHPEYDEEIETFTSKEFNILEEAIVKDLRERADDLYSTLSQEYDSLTTKESIIESLDANDHYYYVDGEEE